MTPSDDTSTAPRVVRQSRRPEAPPGLDSPERHPRFLTVMRKWHKQLEKGEAPPFPASPGGRWGAHVVRVWDVCTGCATWPEAWPHDAAGDVYRYRCGTCGRRWEGRWQPEDLGPDGPVVKLWEPPVQRGTGRCGGHEPL
jgi:hypothetical protein